MPQTTLGESVVCRGISLHSGHEVSVEFRPASENSGIVFHIHSEDGVHLLSLRPEAVSTTELATTVSDGKVSVSTIEHVLAALNGLGVDNVEVHVFGGEAPILDGSAKIVVDALLGAGLRAQNAPRRVARVVRECSLEKDGKSIVARPFDGFLVDYTIRFPHPAIGEQRFVLNVTPETFEKEVAPARTFGFLKEVEYLHSRGLARGGSLDNVVVVGDEGVINKEGLRFPDEFVRHKMLDFIGDMAMLGRPMLGAFTVSCSGHGHNNAFLRKLVREEGLLEYADR
ncbi:UDP-3-O-acyl-N-acetylglucosamine deacetylase [Mailhella sp.]|uniref:UDP-3-O-acyl-N-acetylglucosamine deacetylase n=1 Tax=Mailhella sp. TaxID=1981029 RepID=UPI003AB14622